MDMCRREPLLTEKGEVNISGWSPEDVFEYNKDRIRRPRDAWEWDHYHLFNDRFAFLVTYGHSRGMGLVAAELLDFETGESFRAGTQRLMPGDSMDLDTTGGEDHIIKAEDENFFLSMKRERELREIKLSSEHIEAALYVHEDGDAIVRAVPFSRRGEFSLSFGKCFLDLAGEISVHNADLMLDEDTFLFYESVRGVFPSQYSRFRACGAQSVGEHILALYLGRDNADDAGEENESALFIDGRIQKLGRIRTKPELGAGNKPIRIFDEDGFLHLEFSPTENFPGRSALPILSKRHCRQVYGHVNGTAETENGEVFELRDMPFFCENVNY